MKRWIASAVCASLLSWLPPSAAREPPAAGCIDLQDVAGGWRTGERKFLVRKSGEGGVHLELDPACPAFADGVALETLAPGGWACSGGQVFVRGGGNICPVIRMQPLSAAELAETLRKRDADTRATVTLDRVEVREHHWRDIRGTTDYCVDARFLRGWREDSDGLVVEVSPRRHSGHRYYRVRTVNKCSDLASARSIRLVSRSGGAAVCGYPGDEVVLTNDSAGFARMGGPRTGAFGFGCEIESVTPLVGE